MTEHSVSPSKASPQAIFRPRGRTHEGRIGADDRVATRRDNKSDSPAGEEHHAPGFAPALHVGEDVDFCWRMRDAGYSLLYVPFGKVAHKHRNRLWKMLKRRFDYGTSEALLHGRHPKKRKRFALPAFAALSLLSIAAAIVLLQPYALLGVPFFFALDVLSRRSTLIKSKIRVGLRGQLLAALRNHLGFFYFASFHIVRYYLVLLLVGGIFHYPVWVLSGFLLLVISVTDYLVKRPPLPYPVFLSLYTLEHLFYQYGVFWGCVKQGSFRAYLVSIRGMPS